ncbi:hypothetical protein IGI37_003046 [Enterococcus sp. AZ194]|uniref:MutH/Sau3AI family endonuclease n=1 Tax=Enterococcus sp. AZ194 TaxID=2774629 RepID=UPI003F2326E2
MTSPYKTKQAVHNRAREAVGVTLWKLLTSENQVDTDSKNISTDLIWKKWFKVSKEHVDELSMIEAGVEAITVPYRKQSNGIVSALQQLEICSIDVAAKEEDFKISKFYKTSKILEIAFYEFNPAISRAQWTIDEVIQFSFPKRDLKVIQQDWDLINSYIVQGRSKELTEGLTNYLAASRRVNKMTGEVHLFYSLKPSYMSYLIREFVFGSSFDSSIRKTAFIEAEVIDKPANIEKNEAVESVISDEEFKRTTFDKLLIEKLSNYIGETESNLGRRFLVERKHKNFYSVLASSMLGMKGNLENAEEIQKANILVKTIRVSKKNSVRESMSFPTLKFKKLVEEEWNTSTLRTMFETSRFLFIVFKENSEDEYVFRGAKFWSMPEADLDGKVKEAWEETVKTLKNGVNLTFDKGRVTNNLVGLKDKKIIHVRPHASKASYIENNSNADELPTKAHWTNKPDGYSNYWMTKQSFWFNKDYVIHQIESLL